MGVLGGRREVREGWREGRMGGSLELELGLGFDKSEIKATSAQLELELWLSLGITGL